MRRSTDLADRLDAYLHARGSPLAGEGEKIVKYGQKHRVDPRLLVALAGAETSFGTDPNAGQDPAHHNVWGWGPHIKFRSWDDALDTIAGGLRREYLGKGLTSIAAIGQKWAPSSENDTNRWAQNVGKFFHELGGADKLVTPPSLADTSALPVPEEPAFVVPTLQPLEQPEISAPPSTDGSYLPSQDPNFGTQLAMQSLGDIAAGQFDPVGQLADTAQQIVLDRRRAAEMAKAAATQTEPGTVQPLPDTQTGDTQTSAAGSPQALAEQAATKYGIDPNIFKALVGRESGWSATAGSPKGAEGWVQIHLPSHPDVTLEQAQDPAFAFDWGARYLASQLRRFGSYEKALAAYNAGPGAVESGKWKSYGETTAYVRNVLSDAKQMDEGGGTAAAQAGETQVGEPMAPAPDDYFGNIPNKAINDPNYEDDAPQLMLSAIALAQKLGLHVGENPYVESVEPVHVGDSFHYQNYKGEFDGKTLGRAADISGSPEQMAKFADLAYRVFGKRLTQLFYDPAGGVRGSIRYGQPLGHTIGGHSDHVHIAF